MVGRGLEPIPSQSALFRLVRTFFADITAQRPLLIVLEDLHWSDLESPVLLRYLVRELESKQALIVATYRDDELTRRDPSLSAHLPILVRESAATRIDLRRWNTDEISEIVRQQYRLDDEDLERIGSYLYDADRGQPALHPGDAQYAGGRSHPAALWRCMVTSMLSTVSPFPRLSSSSSKGRSVHAGCVYQRKCSRWRQSIGQEVSLELLMRFSGTGAVLTLRRALDQALVAQLLR